MDLHHLNTLETINCISLQIKQATERFRIMSYYDQETPIETVNLSLEMREV